MFRFPAILLYIFYLILFCNEEVNAEVKYFSFTKENPQISLSNTFPPAQGWPKAKLAEALLYLEEAGATAVIVIHHGQLVIEWGDTAQKTSSHSVRKSLLSGLYGIAVQKEYIDLSTTLQDWGIDDRPPCLTETEKQATVKQLLQARSGVYHLAAAESADMKMKRPSRGAFLPGQHWYYNNWDFNALGTIFERATDISIGEAFYAWIATRVGMRDFQSGDVQYKWEEVSLHPAYTFWISARDLALFGQLYLQEGRWGDSQVIPADWVRESTFPHSKMEKLGYGYMWWTHHSGAYFAAGFMGQRVLVYPQKNLVIVTRVFTGSPVFAGLSQKMRNELKKYVDPLTGGEFRNFIDLIIEAMPAKQDNQELQDPHK